jgi:transposase-like protein
VIEINFHFNLGIIGIQYTIIDPQKNRVPMAKSKYTDDFKIEVAEAATEEGVTLKSVGEKFGVDPTLVRNWKIQFASSSGSDADSGDENVFVWHIDRAISRLPARFVAL